MLLHTEFVAEVNSTGDISYTEMSVVCNPEHRESDSYMIVCLACVARSCGRVELMPVTVMHGGVLK